MGALAHGSHSSEPWGLYSASCGALQRPTFESKKIVGAQGNSSLRPLRPFPFSCSLRSVFPLLSSRHPSFGARAAHGRFSITLSGGSTTSGSTGTSPAASFLQMVSWASSVAAFVRSAPVSCSTRDPRTDEARARNEEVRGETPPPPPHRLMAKSQCVPSLASALTEASSALVPGKSPVSRSRPSGHNVIFYRAPVQTLVPFSWSLLGTRNPRALCIDPLQVFA